MSPGTTSSAPPSHEGVRKSSASTALTASVEAVEEGPSIQMAVVAGAGGRRLMLTGIGWAQLEVVVPKGPGKVYTISPANWMRSPPSTSATAGSKAAGSSTALQVKGLGTEVSIGGKRWTISGSSKFGGVTSPPPPSRAPPADPRNV